MLRVQRVPGGVRVSVRLQPRASSSEVVGVVGDALKVRVTAPPVDGAANDMLVRVLAKAFGIPASRLSIVAGAAARSKVVELSGVTESDVQRITGATG